MTSRRLIPVLLASAVAVALACFEVPKPVLEGRSCDLTHPCVDGYRCVDGLCAAVAVDASVAGPDASSDQCTTGVPLCREGDWYECPSGTPQLKAACSDAGLDCEGARGCLAPCGSGCQAGTACDQASQRCVRQPWCENAGDCGDGGTLACRSGACVPPSTQARVALGGDAGTAQLGCYGAPTADAGVSGRVPMTGFVVTPNGMMTPQTVGLKLKVYAASDFNEQANPTELTFGDTVAGGDAGVGTFAIANVPVGVELVVETAGTGAVTTYQYLTLRSEDVSGGVAKVAVTSFDRELWQELASDSQAQVRAGRGGISGQVFDCRTPPAKVKGATVALDTPVAAYYAFDNVVGIDVEARATSDNGRFFFFDVPALPLTLVTDLDETIVTRRVRVKPDSVTVLQVRP